MQGEKTLDIQDGDKFMTVMDSTLLYQVRGDRERDIDDSGVGDWLPHNRLDGEIDVPMNVAKRILTRCLVYKITEASPEDSLPVVKPGYAVQNMTSGSMDLVYETYEQAVKGKQAINSPNYRIVKLA